MAVTVYSTPTCPWCVRAKDFLKGKNVNFTEHDVSSDAKARDEMVKKSGQRGVPVLDINGKIIIGFDREEIEKELRL